MFHLFQTVNLYRDPESCEGHLRPVSNIAWNPDGEQSVQIGLSNQF